jgi:hypothetical protein
LNYAEFTAAPVEAMNEVLDFLGLEPSAEVEEFARSQVARKSERATQKDLSARELLVGGDGLAALA